MKLLSLGAVGLLALAFSAGTALAFHDGGVAECAGCHTMHNSQDGQQVADTPTGNDYLLKQSTSTDQCLQCHANYGQFYGGLGYGPGGDFYWLTKTFQWEAHGHDYFSTGDSHGHNVESPDFGIPVEGTLTHAPGGDFLSSRLGCTSCHDPHGNQSFRILYGSALGPVYNGTRYNFTADAPEALGNSRRTYPGSGGEETDAQHTIYKNGMTDWCANCHSGFHSGITTNSVHPTGDNLGGTVAGTYNAYVSSDDLSSGDVATSYWGLVPFEAVNVDLGTVDPQNYTQGPVGADQVMCLTCHRSHASAFADAGRWDFGETFIVDSHPATGDIGATPDDIANKYYEYTFVQNQRSLCNKCHVKDEFDAGY